MLDKCPNCGHDQFLMIEYGYDKDLPQIHYDGISVEQCLGCNNSYGRWSGIKLEDNEWELPYGQGILFKEGEKYMVRSIIQ